MCFIKGSRKHPIIRIPAGFAGAVLMLIICLSAAGCSGAKRTDHMDGMKKYAEQKYGDTFETVSFRAAKDETYYDVLVLEKGGVRFNVLRAGDGSMFDTYPEAIVNDKVAEYLKSHDEFGLDEYEFYLDAFPKADGTLDYEFASQKSGEDICAGGLNRLIVVIVTREDIKSQKEALFRSYSALTALDPKHFSFEVLKISGEDEKLMSMLHNMTGTYENDWSSFSGVASWLSAASGAASAEELAEGVH